MHTTQGSLAQIALPELLRQYTLKQYTGTLTINHAGIEKNLYLDHGKLIYIASNKSGERLAEYLVHTGDLTKAWAGFLLKDSQRNGINFTSSLLKKNIFDVPLLEKNLSELAASAVADVITWTSGTYAFRPNLPQQVIDGPIKISEEDIIAAAIKTGDNKDSEDAKILRLIAQKISSKAFHLPVLPHIVERLDRLWENPDNEEILRTVRNDQVLSANLLQVLNAGTAALEHPCSSLEDARRLYPAEHLSGIVRAKATTAQRPHQVGNASQLQQHALSCALLAEQVAAQLGTDTQLAFTCGLLHNIGKAALLQLLAEHADNGIDINLYIKRFHQNTGALLARRWNLPAPVYTAIKCCSDPGKAEEFGLITQIIYLSHRFLLDPSSDSDLRPGCPDIDFDILDISALSANLELIDELVAAAFRS